MIWIAELIIWLLLLVLVSNGIMYFKYNYKKNFYNYQIFLPDVDGLINGSPVKVMGIQVGYINQLDVVGEDVFVKFIITEPSVHIPPGSTATVEFSGLGGSKSLELYPPAVHNNIQGKFIITQPPKRIHDSLGLFNDMFDQLINITYDVSRFMDKVGIIKRKTVYNKVEKTKSIEEFLNFSDGWLDRAQKKCDRFSETLKKMNRGKNEKYYGEKGKDGKN